VFSLVEDILSTSCMCAFCKRCNSDRKRLWTHIYVNLFWLFWYMESIPEVCLHISDLFHICLPVHIVKLYVRIEAYVKYMIIFMNNSTEQLFLETDSRLAIKMFPAFHGTRRFTTVYTRAVHQTLL
jgi:hypothetical protein